MEREYRLISYCIPTDDGAAPNPYWGTCSLVICKPVIRRVTAEVDDWIIGTGSKNVQGVDYSNRLVYAMKVDQKIPMEKYDELFMDKKPDASGKDKRKWVGDSIYDFNSSLSSPSIRKGVHDEGNRERDLGGKFALLSQYFFYFGKNAQLIPDNFKEIVRQTQGHQFEKNEKHKVGFIDWLERTYGEERKINNGLFGDPQLLDFTKGVCGACRFLGDTEDEERARNKWDEGC